MSVARCLVFSVLSVIACSGSAWGAWGADDVLPAAGARLDASARGDANLDDGRWHLSAEPGVWYVAPSGSIHMPQRAPGAALVYPSILRTLGMDNPRVSPTAEINLTRGPWGATIRASSLSLSQVFTIPGAGTIGDINFAAGSSLRGSLDLTSIEVEGRYRFFHTSVGSRGQLRPRIDGVFGARVNYVDWNFEQLTPVSSVTHVGEMFLSPILGVKGQLDLYDKVTVDMQTAFGYAPISGRHTSSWDIMLGFQWRPIDNLGIQIGYRQLVVDFSTGEGAAGFEYSGALAGLFFGIVVRF
jgi:hypothetical protein